MSNETTEILEDFSGGLNTRFAPNRIKKGQTPTSTNCWYDVGALSKRNGATIDTTTARLVASDFVAYRGIQIRRFVNAATDALIIHSNIGQSRYVLVYTNNASTYFVAPRFATVGSVTTSIGSATVTGSGTTFLAGRAGDLLYVESTNEYLIIQSVTNDIELVTTTTATANAAGASYQVIPSWASTSRLSFVEMNSSLWICGRGSVSGQFTGGTAVAAADAFPQASYSIVYANYVFAASTTDNPSRVRWCNLKDPTTWPASNFIDVNPDDGFPIVGMFLDGQSIVVLKTNSAYKITGEIFDPANPTYTLQQIFVPSDFLINGPGSVQIVNGKYLMLGQKGFYAYTGGSTIQFVEESNEIKNQFTTIAGYSLASAASPTVEPYSAMVDGKYWLSVEDSQFSHTTGFKNVVWVIDEEGTFWRWNQGTNAQVSGFAYRTGTLYGVNADTGGTAGLQTLNTGTVDTGSTAINGTWTSKIFEYPNQQQFLVANVFYKKQGSGNLTFEWSIDEGSFSSATIDMTAGSGTRVKSPNVTLGTAGSTIQFRLSNATASQTFEVYGIQWIRRPLKQ